MIKKNSQGKHREGLWKDKEWLENQYINLNKTCDNIAEICDCGSTTIRYWLIYFDIPIRSISEGKKGRKILNYKYQLGVPFNSRIIPSILHFS